MLNESPVLKASSTAAPKASMAVATWTPAATADARPACDDVGGQLVGDTYVGLVSGKEIPFWIYLPPCYEDGVQSYPVVYLLHGYPYDQNHWVDLGLLEAYEAGPATGRWPAVVYVFPYAPEPLFTRTDGGDESYEQEFMEGLVPAIEEAYRVDRDPDQRVLAGVSRGGVWALEIGMRNADQIQHVLAISPALVYNQPRASYDPFQDRHRRSSLAPDPFH